MSLFIPLLLPDHPCRHPRRRHRTRWHVLGYHAACTADASGTHEHTRQDDSAGPDPNVVLDDQGSTIAYYGERSDGDKSPEHSVPRYPIASGIRIKADGYTTSRPFSSNTR